MLLKEAICYGAQAANRKVRIWFPGLKFHVHDDEDLFRQGKSVRYHVELDKNGEPQLSSFGATAGRSIGTTIAHAVFGVRAPHTLPCSLSAQSTC